MDERLKKWDNAEDMWLKADDILRDVVEDTIRNVIPFNEDDRFIFTDDGGMDKDDMPTLWKYGIPNDIPYKLRGFEIFNKRVEALLGEGEEDETSCRLFDINPTSYEEMKWAIDNWLKKSGK